MAGFTATERDRAFHEAGHCWGFWSWPIAFRYVTLQPRTGLDGATMSHRQLPWDQVGKLPRIVLAGPVAELLHRVGPDLVHSELREHIKAVNDGALHDFSLIDGFDRDEALIQGLKQNLAAHWAGVTALAEVLIEQRTVKGKDAFALLDEALEDAPPLVGMPWTRTNPRTRLCTRGSEQYRTMIWPIRER